MTNTALGHSHSSLISTQQNKCLLMVLDRNTSKSHTRPLHLVARGKAVRISSHARLETSMHGPCNTIDGPRHSMACKTEPVVEFRGPPRRSSGKTPKTVRFRPSGWSSPNNFKPTDVDTEGRDTHDYARQARACLKSFGSGHGCSATKPPITARCGATKAATSATVFETIRLRDGQLPA